MRALFACLSDDGPTCEAVVAPLTYVPVTVSLVGETEQRQNPGRPERESYDSCRLRGAGTMDQGDFPTNRGAVASPSHKSQATGAGERIEAKRTFAFSIDAWGCRGSRECTLFPLFAGCCWLVMEGNGCEPNKRGN